MKKSTITFLLILLLIITSIFCIYAFIQNNKMILQGEVEVKSIDLASKIPGRVLSINHQKGERVKKGDVILILDTPEIDAKASQVDAVLELAKIQQEKVNNGARTEQIEIAKAQRDFAQKTYDRLSRLHSEGVIPTQKLDEAQAKYQAAQDTYNMLVTGSRYEDKALAYANVKKALGATAEVNSYVKENKITAPIDGIITDITVDEGELVGQGYPIVTIADDSNYWITFNLREDLLTKIKNGTEFKVVIPAISKTPINVKVNYISVLGDFATYRATKARGEFDMKTFEVHAIPTEKIEGLRAGMSAVFDWKKIK